MEVDYAWQLLTGADVGLEVTALQLQALLIDQFQICALDLHRVSPVQFWSCIVSSLPRFSTVYSALGGLMMALQSCS